MIAVQIGNTMLALATLNMGVERGRGLGQPRPETRRARVRLSGPPDPRDLATGPQDRRTNKAAGLATKLTVLWQWTGRYFEH